MQLEFGQSVLEIKAEINVKSKRWRIIIAQRTY